MITKQPKERVLELQDAIYGVALSLDAFLLNGIQIGVIHGSIFDGFVEKVASNLLRDLENLEEIARTSLAGIQPMIAELLLELRSRCQELIDLVSSLSGFKTFALEQVRLAVAQILALREECVQRIQELEQCFRTPEPFYQSRANDSTTAVNDFLGNLERVLTDEWAAIHATR